MMSDYEKTIRVLKALSSKPRIQILECVQKGITNPAEIAKALRRDRSTVEQHLRVLLEAKIIEKVPSMSKEGQVFTQYNMRSNANEFLSRIHDLIKDF